MNGEFSRSKAVASKILLVTIATCIALSIQAASHYNVLLDSDGKFTFDLPNAELSVAIQILQKEIQNAYAQVGTVDSENSSITDMDDSISVSNNVVVYHEGHSRFLGNDIRVDDASDELQALIKIETQKLSYMISNLLNEIWIHEKEQGEKIASHIIFLNTYTELMKLSHAKLEIISWLDEKLVRLDQHVVKSLKYLNDWVDWVEKILSYYEINTGKGFNKSMDWLNLTRALKRINREQRFSKELEIKIDQILNKTVDLSIRRDWYKLAIEENFQPKEIIFYRADTEKIVPKTFPLEYQYTRINFGF